MNTEKKKALILISNSAGPGKNANYVFSIIKKFAQSGYEPIVYPIIPKSPLESERLLAEYDDGTVDLIVCAGGDGTLNHMTNAVMNMKNKTRIGYIPTGSTNDFARSFDIPFDVDAACDEIIWGKPFDYDVGIINGRYFNYVTAFGAFSDVSYSTSQEFKNIFGHAAYIVSAAGDLVKNMSYCKRIRVECDDFCAEDDYIFGAVCNSSSIGGTSVLKNAEIIFDDGQMELFLIKAPTGPDGLQAILYSLHRHELNNPYITFKKVSSVKFFADEGLEWSVDGEYGGMHTDTEIKVVRRGMTIMRMTEQ